MEIDVAVPMRDGTRLATDLYYPAAPGRYPVLLERTPYGKHQSVMVSIEAPQYLSRCGFIVAIQDTRGRYASEGIWYPFRDEGWGENRDGYDTVEWLAAQPWSTGKTGTFGGSFAGFNQYLMAGDPSPHLDAVFARQAPCSLRREWVFRGGAFELGFMFIWGARQSMEALRNRSAQLNRAAYQDQMELLKSLPLARCPLFSDPFEWIKDYLRFQDDENYWKQWDIAPYHETFRVPTYHLASWYDIFLGGTLRNFMGITGKTRSEYARRKHRLTIGPWLHGPGTEAEREGRIAGEVDFGEVARWNYKEEMAHWFRHWLKEEANTFLEDPPIRYFVMGLNQWKTADQWPPRSITDRNLYFNQRPGGAAASLYDGSLEWTPPIGSAVPARFLHDPDDPVPALGGNTLYSLRRQRPGGVATWEDLNAEAGSRDQRRIEDRCLAFTSPPLEDDLEVTGPVVAYLYVSSTAVDTDFVVRLCRVCPDGRSMLVCDGIQRARYRESDFRPTLLEPGTIYRISVDLWATSILLRRGERIRVLVNSSSFPRFDVNPGTGESAAVATRRVQAENQVYMDASHASYIRLPVSGI